MFVKAGIVAAVAAASLVAVSPLAFAGDYDNDNHKSSRDDSDDSDSRDDSDDSDDDRGDRRHRDNDDDCNNEVNQVNTGDSRGLINVSGVNAAVPINACDNDILSGVLGVLSKDLTNNDND